MRNRDCIYKLFNKYPHFPYCINNNIIDIFNNLDEYNITLFEDIFIHKKKDTILLLYDMICLFNHENNLELFELFILNYPNFNPNTQGEYGITIMHILCRTNLSHDISSIKRIITYCKNNNFDPNFDIYVPGIIFHYLCSNRTLTYRILKLYINSFNNLKYDILDRNLKTPYEYLIDNKNFNYKMFKLFIFKEKNFKDKYKNKKHKKYVNRYYQHILRYFGYTKLNIDILSIIWRLLKL